MYYCCYYTKDSVYYPKLHRKTRATIVYQVCLQFSDFKLLQCCKCWNVNKMVCPLNVLSFHMLTLHLNVDLNTYMHERLPFTCYGSLPIVYILTMARLTGLFDAGKVRNLRVAESPIVLSCLNSYSS